MVRLGELRKAAIERMTDNNIKEARADTDFLLFFFTGADKKDILLGNRPVEKKSAEAFNAAVKRRIEGEPVQYITGETEFMSLKFSVNRATLIPRADTEVLVEKCMELVEKKSLKTILDIGTGSGCIGLSIAYYCRQARVTLLDVSGEALKTAEKNAAGLKVSDRVGFCRMDILHGGAELESFDLIVSNPPYIETGVLETLDKKVISYEPRTALDGGEDGLIFYRKITEIAAYKSKWLAFEIGYNQGDTVRKIMSEYFSDIELIKDYGGNSRVLIGKNRQI